MERSADCPCCGFDPCIEDCTFAIDCPEEHAEMTQERELRHLRADLARVTAELEAVKAERDALWTLAWGKCCQCGWVGKPDHSSGDSYGHTRSEHDYACDGECNNCPVAVSCGPMAPIGQRREAAKGGKE